MYQIYSESAKTLIDSSNNIRLPRFQRKQTWNDKKNFELCISIFNDYPIGMFVLNNEDINTPQGPVPTLWLLDGRQRRNALRELYRNPENVYKWAIKFIKFRKTDSIDQIEIKFWESILLHLESDEEIEEVAVIDEGHSLHLYFEDEYDDPNVGLEEDSPISNTVIEDKYYQGLDLLLKIIKMCHKVDPTSSGYTKVFDFSEYFISLNYIETNNLGERIIKGSELTVFITNFLNYVNKKNVDEFEEDDFFKFLIAQNSLKSSKHSNKLMKYISRHWEKIKHRIYIVNQISLQLNKTKVGIIQLTNGSKSDAQNIFKLINSSGTTLTAVEILSAKPSWNKPIKKPSDQLEKVVDSLYGILGVKRQGVVLWDYPATLLDRLESLNFLFPALDYKIDTQFKSKVTLGFKLLAGLFEGGITKEKMSGLSKSRNINWDEVDIVLKDLNTIGQLLKEASLFHYMNTWNATLYNLTSEAICLNFLILTYKNWIAKERPMGNSANFSSFLKDTYALFDRMIFEYTFKYWRGASDSRFADNIARFDVNKTFKAVPEERWIELLNELINKGTIQDQIADQKDLKAIVYYYYMLSAKHGPRDSSEAIEMDHIISKHSFTSTTSHNTNRVNNICNFCLLAKSVNNKKKQKSLAEIYHQAQTDQDYKLLAQDISNSTDIDIDNFLTFTNAYHFDRLVDMRKDYLITAFSQKRNLLLN